MLAYNNACSTKNRRSAQRQALSTRARGVFGFPLTLWNAAVLHLLSLALTLAANTRALADIEREWEIFKGNFITSDGRVVDRENGGVSHTEGQGWGMLMAVRMGDREIFDELWFWTQAHLSRPGAKLYSWRYDPHSPVPVTDRNNASDGDLAIAWALMQAADRWQDPIYEEQSKDMRDAIWTHLVKKVGGYTVLSPAIHGFSKSGGEVINLSYMVLPALQDFHAREPDRGWAALIRDFDRIMMKVTDNGRRLPPDWLYVSEGGVLTAAPQWPDRFGFEAVRVPLFMAWAGSDSAMLNRLASRWRQASARAGGVRLAAWVNRENGKTAPYPASAGVARIWQVAASPESPLGPAPAYPESYYSAALSLLAKAARTERAARTTPLVVPSAPDYIDEDWRGGRQPASDSGRVTWVNKNAVAFR